MKKRLLSIALALSLIAPVCASPTAEAYSTGTIGKPSVIGLSDYYGGAVTSDGSLWLWGYSFDDTKVFLGEANTVESPQKIMSGVKSLAVNQSCVAVVKKDGSLWVWGRPIGGSYKSAGERFNNEEIPPTKIMDGVEAVSLNGKCAAAIKQDGSLWTWGYNQNGQLGNGTYSPNDKPVVETPVKIMDDVVSVVVNGLTSAAVKKDGTLWMWGFSRCDIMTYGIKGGPSPTKVMDGVVAVDLGHHHAAVIKEDGTLWMWGNYSDGKLGIEVTDVQTEGYSSCTGIPHKVMSDVVDVSLGFDYSTAIKKDGSLWVWGNNTGRQLGVDSPKAWYVPEEKPVKLMDNVADVYAMNNGTIAVKKDGSVWVWGRNYNHYLGLPNKGIDYFPTQLMGLKVSVPDTTQKCTITLNLNGGDGVTKLTCDKNGTITPPNNPSRDGYFFAGWYKDKACTKPWNFDTDKVTGNCTLYAKWEPKSTTTVTAEPSTQKVEIDGKKIILNSYVLRNDQGYPVNFVKLRDIAYLLDGTEANFNVDWRNNAIRLDARQPYTTPNGAEMTVPTVMAAPAKTSITPVLTGGVTAPLEAFLLTDKNGGGHNYFKLRDIGKVAGFNVEWDGARGIIVVTTTEDYIG